MDAEQTQLVVEGLATPMGVYPNAMLRAGDLHFAELQGDWRLSYPLPARPSWVDDDDQVFARRRVHSGACGAHVGNAGPGKTSVAACDAFTDSANAAAPAASPSSSAPAPLEKYFLQRYMLFSKYDRGVKLDSEGWYSVTPEVLAAHMAERCRCDMIIDAFTGVGGNAIQFAYTCERVVAIDLDASRLELAKHNAAVYNVADRVEWIHADFFALAPLLRADVVFLSPPWGGPQYQLEESFDVVTMMGGLDGAEILRQSLRIAPNVCYFLPKNTNEAQLEALAAEARVPLELERCSLNGHVKGIVAYFGFEQDGEDDDSL